MERETGGGGGGGGWEEAPVYVSRRVAYVKLSRTGSVCAYYMIDDSLSWR